MALCLLRTSPRAVPVNSRTSLQRSRSRSDLPRRCPGPNQPKWAIFSTESTLRRKGISWNKAQTTRMSSSIDYQRSTTSWILTVFLPINKTYGPAKLKLARKSYLNKNRCLRNWTRSASGRLFVSRTNSKLTKMLLQNSQISLSKELSVYSQLLLSKNWLQATLKPRCKI